MKKSGLSINKGSINICKGNFCFGRVQFFAGVVTSKSSSNLKIKIDKVRMGPRRHWAVKKDISKETEYVWPHFFKINAKTLRSFMVIDVTFLERILDISVNWLWF